MRNTLKQPISRTNNPFKAGRRASKAVFFGISSRFACFAVHTRGDKVQWFVSDAETPDLVTGSPNSIIRQANSFEDATLGFDL